MSIYIGASCPGDETMKSMNCKSYMRGDFCSQIAYQAKAINYKKGVDCAVFHYIIVQYLPSGFFYKVFRLSNYACSYVCG